MVSCLIQTQCFAKILSISKSTLQIISIGCMNYVIKALYRSILRIINVHTVFNELSQSLKAYESESYTDSISPAPPYVLVIYLLNI